MARGFSPHASPLKVPFSRQEKESPANPPLGGGEEQASGKFTIISPLIFLRLNLSNLVFAPPMPFPAIEKPLVLSGFEADFWRLTTIYTFGPFQSG